MIRINLYLLPLLYAVSGLVLVFFLWLYSFRRRRKFSREEKSQLFQCRLCASWLHKAGGSHEGSLLRCPCCGALNEPTLRPNSL